MNFSEYQEEAAKVRLPSADANYVVLGLPGEVGEVLSLFAKGIRDGYRDNHRELLTKELGDVLWFIAAIADDEDINLDYVAQENIAKLNSRKDRGTLQGSGDNR